MMPQTVPIDTRDAQELLAACLRVEALADDLNGWDLEKFTPIQLGNKIRAALNGNGTRMWVAMRRENGAVR